MSMKKSNWISSFGLSHSQPWLFYEPKCAIPMSLYVLYRVLIAGYFVVIYVWDIVFKYGRPTPQMAYMTMWSYLLQTISLLWKMLVTVYKASTNKCKRTDQIPNSAYVGNLPLILQIEWILHVMGTSIPIMVGASYLIRLDMEYMKYRHATEEQFLHFAIQMHGINSVLALLDLLMTAIPIQLLHFYQPMMFPIFYWVFGYLYYAVTGNNAIYPDTVVTEVGPNLKTLATSEGSVLAAFVFIWIIYNLQTRFCCQNRRSAIDIRNYDEKTPLVHSSFP